MGYAVAYAVKEMAKRCARDFEIGTSLNHERLAGTSLLISQYNGAVARKA
jgi:hypothetical protein